MSLDVYLVESAPRPCSCTCPECGNEHTTEQVRTWFDANITHNLGPMAEAAGIYHHLWRPEEIGIQRAQDLIAPLRSGLERLRADPRRFRAMDASNFRGRYVDLVPWLEAYIDACERHPEALVMVSR